MIITTRTTGTVHTSAKACLTSVAIWIWIAIRIPDRDRNQNLITFALTHCQPSLNTSCKDANRQIERIALS